MRLKYIGIGDSYFPGYPNQDLPEMEDESPEVARLISTGLWREFTAQELKDEKAELKAEAEAKKEAEAESPVVPDLPVLVPAPPDQVFAGEEVHADEDKDKPSASHKKGSGK
jgi:hypothetical protein